MQEYASEQVPEYACQNILLYRLLNIQYSAGLSAVILLDSFFFFLAVQFLQPTSLVPYFPIIMSPD